MRDSAGAQSELQAEHIISSAPLKELALAISPKMSKRATQAAGSLKYRDFLTVALIIKDREQFSDNWIYIHDPQVQVGRIQNFKSWSPEMVPDPDCCCYGLEYFCFKDDGLWLSSDEELIELAKSEIEKIGLAKATDVLDGCVSGSLKHIRFTTTNMPRMWRT
jgi:protoporphyrinogen oxidase